MSLREPAVANTNIDLAPVVEDLSIYLGGGRSDPALSIAQAVEAERLGFRRVWIGERYNIKEAGVLMGAIAARTTHLGVGIAAMPIAARRPNVTAAIGATIHAAFGPRCVIGLGRGTNENNVPYGLGPAMSYAALIDYADILRRLWRGETVTYDGPAGCYTNIVFTDRFEGPPPEVWFSHYGGPMASKVCANPVFDGAAMSVLLSPEAMARSIAMTRQECERIGRDPASLRIMAGVATAPDVHGPETTSPLMANPAYGSGPVTMDSLKALIALTIQQPFTGLPFAQRNGWDENIYKQIEHHPIFHKMDGAKGELDADHQMRNRMDMMAAARLVPDSWVHQSCAVGSMSACVKKLQEFRDAGVDEVGVYVSTPSQNAGLIAAWRERSAVFAAG